MVGREVAMVIGWLRLLRRKDGGVCGTGVVDVGWVETLGFGRGVVTLGAGYIDGDGTFGVVVWVENISVSWRSASIWGFETGANGDAGCGCWSAAVKFFAASIAASVDNVVGMEDSCGKTLLFVLFVLRAFFYVHFVASVMLRCITDVPTI